MKPRPQDRSAGSLDNAITCHSVVTILADSLVGALEPETAMALQEHLRHGDAWVAFMHTSTGTLHAIYPF
jgi:hypothetical protein